MQFRHYNQLKVFTIVAKIGSISAAAEELNLTKGAVSHQIKQLETTLGFKLFERLPRGVALSQKGLAMLNSTEEGYSIIESRIQRLQNDDSRALTVGVSTYFASRWLSPRLTSFLDQHPDIRLRLQPMIELTNLANNGIDVAIRWGSGHWHDVESILLFACPAWPSGNSKMSAVVVDKGLEHALKEATLLHDSEHSAAWREWFSAAGVTWHDPEKTLIIPDPNVRVQAVIDGQGIALNDSLVEGELESGKLHRLSKTALDSYGYHIVWASGTTPSTDVLSLSNWLQNIA